MVDEATLFGRAWSPERILADELAQEALDEVNANAVPAHLSLPVGLSRGEGKRLADQIEIAYRCGRLQGYTMYESAALYDREATGADGRLHFRPGLTEAVRARAEALGFI